MKKIQFIPSSQDCELLVDYPLPAKLEIPEWYKKIPAFKEKKLKDIIFNEFGKMESTTPKMCMPFFDALSGGYIQKTWTDIYIEHDIISNSVKFYSSSHPEIIRIRNSSNVKIDEDQFCATEFVWIEPWVPKLPEGYSIIYTHPFNRLDLPFFSLSAVVDSDKYYHTSSGQYPFYIKRGYSGVIPSGTPMYQMFPVKRDSWGTEVIKFNEQKNKKNNFVISKKFWGAYKNYFWQKKNFN